MKNLIILIAILIGMAITPTALLSQNNCLEFDGSDDYVLFNSETDVASNAIISFEAWVKLNNPVDNNYRILSQSNTGFLDLASNHFALSLNNLSQPVFTIDGISATSSEAISANVWYHLAGTYDKDAGSNQIKLYVNGKLAATATQTGEMVSSSEPIVIGASFTPSQGVDYVMNGFIDDVRIWEKCLTESEIRNNMYNELNGAEANLARYWAMNTGSGTNVLDLDIGGTPNNGTLTNMTGSEWTTSSAIFGPKRCIDFDGIDDFISIPASPAHSTTEFTIEFWMKNDDIPLSYEGVLDKGRSSGKNWYFITYSGGLGVICGMAGAGEIWMAWGDYNWHHIAATFDGFTLTAYLDGRKAYSTTGTMNLDASYNIHMGRWRSGSNPFNGKMDEVRIWNDVRTPSEIRQNMFKNLTGNEAGLALYYTFDITYGTTAIDYSGNGIDGTLNNMSVPSCWTSSESYNTWLNNDDNTWSNINNWSMGSTPSSNGNIGLYDYSGITNVIIAGAPTVQNIFIDSGIYPEITTGITVNKTYTQADSVNLTGGTIIIKDSACSGNKERLRISGDAIVFSNSPLLH